MATPETDTLPALAQPSRGRLLNVSLWIVQILLAAVYGFAGVVKLVTPIAELTARFGWVGMFGEEFARVLGACELTGALGLLLPIATGILPRLTPLAALCLVLVQVCAIAYHISQNEFNGLPLNAALLAAAALVAWGRSRRVPNAPSRT